MPREVRYRAIAEELRGAILSGELTPGQRLPTEEVLAKMHGVHRLTARQAVVELRRAGLVETQHGRGSFVRHAAFHHDASIDPWTRRHPTSSADFVGVTERVRSRGLRDRPDSARLLGLPEPAVFEVDTLTSLDGEPAVLSSYRMRPELADLDFGGTSAVLDALAQRAPGSEYMWHRIAAAPAEPADVEVLAMDGHVAMLLREGLLQCEGTALCHIVRRCRGDRVAFISRYDVDVVRPQ